MPIPGNDTSHNSLEDENHLRVDSNAGTPRAGSRCESPAAPQLEITPYPGPESEDELGPPCPTCYGKGHVDMDDEEGKRSENSKKKYRGDGSVRRN